MADKIQNAYETSKNIYDDVLTQRNIFSKLYIKLFWSGILPSEFNFNSKSLKLSFSNLPDITIHVVSSNMSINKCFKG